MAHLYQVDGNTGVAFFPRGANTAISFALIDCGKRCDSIPRADFIKLPRRYSFWRSPLRRIESAYRYYFNIATGPHDACRDGFSNWVLRVCADPNLSDQHVVPQSDLLQGVETRIIRWDFKRLAEVLGVPTITQEHASDRSIERAWTSEAREAFERRYEQDLRIWRGNETEQQGALPANQNPQCAPRFSDFISISARKRRVTDFGPAGPGVPPPIQVN
jgi:hypothetical protein